METQGQMFIDVGSRADRSNNEWAELKKEKCITVYGSYNDGIKDILLVICDYFKEKGFLDTEIVENRKFPFTSDYNLNWDWGEKCRYWIWKSDINLLFFFKKTDNQSVAIEATVALGGVFLIKSLFFEEKEPSEEYGAIRSVLGSMLTGRRIKAASFSRDGVCKVALKTVFESIY